MLSGPLLVGASSGKLQLTKPNDTKNMLDVSVSIPQMHLAWYPSMEVKS